MAIDNQEVEEIDNDSDTLKPHLVAYFECLNKALNTYSTDDNELQKIFSQLQSDSAIISNICNRVADQISNLKASNVRKAEAYRLIEDGIKARKQ
jgi:hypothetical protein